MDEAALIDRPQTGERAAFDALYALHHAAVLTRLCGPGVQVDDLVQDTFIRAYRSLKRFRGDCPLAWWLLRIATHVARLLGRLFAGSDEAAGLAARDSSAQPELTSRAGRQPRSRARRKYPCPRSSRGYDGYDGGASSSARSSRPRTRRSLHASRKCADEPRALARARATHAAGPAARGRGRASGAWACAQTRTVAPQVLVDRPDGMHVVRRARATSSRSSARRSCRRCST